MSFLVTPHTPFNIRISATCTDSSSSFFIVPHSDQYRFTCNLVFHKNLNFFLIYSINNASSSRTRNVNRFKKATPKNREKLELPENKRLKSNKSDLFHIEDADSDVDWDFLDSIEVQWDALQSEVEDSAPDNVSEISVPQNIIRYMKKVFPRKKKSSGIKNTVPDIKKRDSGTTNENDPLVKLPYEEQTIGLTRTYKVEFKSMNNQLLEKYGKETDRLMTRLDDLCTKKVLKKMNGIMKFQEERKKVIIMFVLYIKIYSRT